MVNRYEEAAREVEDHIKMLEGRLARFESNPNLRHRADHVREEIEALRAKPLAKWRATGKWAEEIWK